MSIGPDLKTPGDKWEMPDYNQYEDASDTVNRQIIPQELSNLLDSLDIEVPDGSPKFYFGRRNRRNGFNYYSGYSQWNNNGEVYNLVQSQSLEQLSIEDLILKNLRAFPGRVEGLNPTTDIVIGWEKRQSAE